jgi:plastocyanin
VRRWLALAACTAALAVLGRPGPLAVGAAGAGLEAIVRDDAGQPLADAVVSVTTAGAPARPRATTAVMDQHDKTFVPNVLPVPVGTPVSFPNRDNIRHHVYSFSPAKRFELPLYIGTPAAPVVFDRPGVVVLGCNIHDWMVGYIYVSATPYFARTGEDGRARLADVPAGTHEARVWHPRMRLEPEKTAKPVTIAPGQPGQVAFVVALKPERRAPPPSPHYQDAPQSGVPLRPGARVVRGARPG